ncbi:MAG: DUF58 domain-containing protein [Ruminococcus sp.]|uniref:DUF58 domain-containing protein n=1 Tax=Ruminococcus sp. TaxID=41978 RepID=UPI0025EB2CA4|nr:DUF58 domain-containing protein [Ruminococcus sp.]MBR6996110.1 DUF58 domain-containing protein [Ruminococcus sp.]
MTKHIKSIVSVIAVAFLVYIFTFYIDGEMGVILLAFVLFAPLVSLFFLLYARKRVKVSFTCDAYAPKGSKLPVKVTVTKTGIFPLAIVEIVPYATEIFGQNIKKRKLTMLNENRRSFTIELDALVGGNGEVGIKEMYSCGFMGFFKLPLKTPLPQPVSIGVIPPVPEIKASSQLFRSIADVVLTSDEEEENDTAMLFSANTSPGYEHREYELGDPLKRINWKLSSKKGRMMVRLDEAVASVQPVVVLDLYRRGGIPAEQVILGEEKLIRSVFGLLSLLVKQGIACNFIYRTSSGETVSESVDNPDYPDQLLLKVLAVKVIPDKRVDLSHLGGSVCACVIATTDASGDFGTITRNVDSPDNISIVGLSPSTPNSTSLPMWYLDEDNNFRSV